MTFKNGVVDGGLQGAYLVLLKGLVAYIFTLLLSTLLVLTVVIEGVAAHSPAASASFTGHNVGYVIAFGW